MPEPGGSFDRRGNSRSRGRIRHKRMKFVIKVESIVLLKLKFQRAAKNESGISVLLYKI